MNIDLHEGQFMYLGRWVDKKGFRAFVYDRKGTKKLADSYEEFISLTESGLWFDVAKVPEKPVRKKPVLKEVKNSQEVENGSLRPDGNGFCNGRLSAH